MSVRDRSRIYRPWARYLLAGLAVAMIWIGTSAYFVDPQFVPTDTDLDVAPQGAKAKINLVLSWRGPTWALILVWSGLGVAAIVLYLSVRAHHGIIKARYVVDTPGGRNPDTVAPPGRRN